MHIAIEQIKHYFPIENEYRLLNSAFIPITNTFIIIIKDYWSRTKRNIQWPRKYISNYLEYSGSIVIS